MHKTQVPGEDVLEEGTRKDCITSEKGRRRQAVSVLTGEGITKKGGKWVGLPAQQRG